MKDLTVLCCAGKSFPISFSRASDDTFPLFKQILNSFSAADLVPALDDSKLRTTTLASCLLADMVLGLSVGSTATCDSSLSVKKANTSGSPADFSAASDNSDSKQTMKHSKASELVPPPFCFGLSVPIDKDDTEASLMAFFMSFIAALARAGNTTLPNFACEFSSTRFNSNPISVAEIGLRLLCESFSRDRRAKKSCFKDNIAFPSVAMSPPHLLSDLLTSSMASFRNFQAFLPSVVLIRLIQSLLSDATRSVVGMDRMEDIFG
mmetsp:Transcript_15589/g.34037  ORF Transcript_15589/g.34037 Transcript_15589/m.34037 type:complete len:264 (-) Transcript_15589:2932-3723(-)